MQATHLGNTEATHKACSTSIDKDDRKQPERTEVGVPLLEDVERR